MITGFTADGLFPTFNTMDEVFGFTWSDDMGKFEKAKGQGAVAITTPGTMNAVYGPLVQNLAYNQHNTLAALGQKPYKTARRFQQDLSMKVGDTSGVVRGGFAPKPVYGDYLQFEMPYKVLAHRFAMNIGMAEIGSKGIDDVLTWQNQVEAEGKTWLWSQNNDVLRRVEDDRLIGFGSAVGGEAGSSHEVVGLESIDRIISNFDEGGHVKAGNNVPWRMYDNKDNDIPSTDAKPIDKYRNPSEADGKADNNLNCYVDSNYTGGAKAHDSAAALRELTLPMIDNMFLSCMPYWDNNSTAGKVCVTGYDTLGKMQMLLQPQQRYMGFQDAQFDINGIKTVQGQNTGFQVATYNGVPLLPDKMIGKGTKEDANAGVGRIYLFDNDILFNGTLRAPSVEVSENPIVTGKYIRMCDMNTFGEIQVAGAFKGLGKIIHLK